MTVGFSDARKLAEDIRQVAAEAHSEEDLRIGVEKLLDPFLEHYGIKRCKYETATRVNAQHGNLFIEYERPVNGRHTLSLSPTDLKLSAIQ